MVRRMGKGNEACGVKYGGYLQQLLGPQISLQPADMTAQCRHSNFTKNIVKIWINFTIFLQCFWSNYCVLHPVSGSHVGSPLFSYRLLTITTHLFTVFNHTSQLTMNFPELLATLIFSDSSDAHPTQLPGFISIPCLAP
jgi:hypothetical protein